MTRPYFLEGAFQESPPWLYSEPPWGINVCESGRRDGGAPLVERNVGGTGLNLWLWQSGQWLEHSGGRGRSNTGPEPPGQQNLGAGGAGAGGATGLWS